MTNKTLESSLLGCLEQIPDLRHKRGIRYKLSHLLLMSIYAVLAGHSEASEISYYVELNFQYFHDLLGINEVPSHDTFSRINKMVSYDELSKHLSPWLYEYFPEMCAKYGNYKVLHVDGKAVRAASVKSDGEKPIYLLNSMYEGGAISLYTKRIEDKTNELGMLPGYLSFFNLQDTIVTIDAIGCGDKIIDTIHSKGGKYILFPLRKTMPNSTTAFRIKLQSLQNQENFKN